MWKHIVTLLVLVLAPAATYASDPASNTCATIHARSFGRVSCSYNSALAEWTLAYSSKSTYRLVKYSGRYRDMLYTLCDAGDLMGSNIREVIISGKKRKARMLTCADNADFALRQPFNQE